MLLRSAEIKPLFYDLFSDENIFGEWPVGWAVCVWQWDFVAGGSLGELATQRWRGENEEKYLMNFGRAKSKELKRLKLIFKDDKVDLQS